MLEQLAKQVAVGILTAEEAGAIHGLSEVQVAEVQRLADRM
jgi:hypothetical protein